MLLVHVSLFNATVCCIVTLPVAVSEHEPLSTIQLSRLSYDYLWNTFHLQLWSPHYNFLIIQQLVSGRKVYLLAEGVLFFVIFPFLSFVTMTFTGFDEGLLHISFC